MKYLFLLLISLNCFAENWMPVSEIESNGSAGYSLELECEKRGEQCLEVGNEPEIISLGFASLVDDWGTESEIEPCQNQNDCQAALENKICSVDLQKFISDDYSHVYCIELLGKSLVKNESAYNSYKANLILGQVIIQSREAAIQAIKESILIKSWDLMSLVERKILLGLSVSDSELGL